MEKKLIEEWVKTTSEGIKHDIFACGYGTKKGEGHSSRYRWSGNDGCDDGTGHSENCIVLLGTESKCIYGYGFGNGCGNGHENGCGSGSGSIFGLKEYNKHYIFLIDGIATIITNIRNNIAKGFIIDGYLNSHKTYIAKYNDLFAHGSTIREAVQGLQRKIFVNMSSRERIEGFKKQFNKQDKYKGSLFFDWHNRLTGSCLQGREYFVRAKGLSLEKDYTVKEFLEIAEGAFGWSILKELVEYYNYEEKNKYGGKRKC